MFKVYELNNLSELEGQGGYFRDFISTRGSIGLHAGENEEPHSVDGVSYVIEGSGFIKLNGDCSLLDSTIN